MIEYRSGDMLAEETEALVNTVNCVGVMGRGIALQFKKAYPENFTVYESACKRKEVIPGRMFVVATRQLTNPRLIINFPTKRHWRGTSHMEDIETGLKSLANEIKKLGIRSIAIPPLGCGLGGLDWPEVRSRIEQDLADLPDVRVIVYEPIGAPEAKKMVKSKKIPKMTPGRAALVGLMDRYLGSLLDPFITLLEVHKLMYFMQEAGEDLRLRYVKATYGPYAENLSHVLKTVEGHYISGYADGGDMPDKLLELIPGAVASANAVRNDNAGTIAHFDRVVDLVRGFETPFGLELLSTVHWIAKHESPKTAQDVIRQTYDWNKRKRQFNDRQIRIALDVLNQKNWISPPIPTGPT